MSSNSDQAYEEYASAARVGASKSEDQKRATSKLLEEAIVELQKVNRHLSKLIDMPAETNR